MITSVGIMGRMMATKLLTGIELEPEGSIDPWWVISCITTVDEVLLTPERLARLRPRGLMGGLTLIFGDILPEHVTEAFKAQYADHHLFDTTQAKLAVAFIREAQTASKSGQLIVHCGGGVARSGAIGTYAAEYCGHDMHAFWDRYRKFILPNLHVLKLLREADTNFRNEG